MWAELDKTLKKIDALGKLDSALDDQIDDKRLEKHNDFKEELQQFEKDMQNMKEEVNDFG